MKDIEFAKQNKKKINEMSNNPSLKKISQDWFDQAFAHEYLYHFTWLGRPIIQFPQDIMAIQELIWKIQPDVIIETGIARGGSLVFSASILELIGKGKVIGIDIDIRKHNKKEIEKHAMYKRITMIEGSSINKQTVKKIEKMVGGAKKVLVLLDSMHTHKHVLKELSLYSKFVKKGGYIVVFDTVIEFMPKDSFPNRSWDIGNNPHTAVKEFLRENKRFKIDSSFEKKLLITSCPDGFLKCV
jgi:cephalosporin hydroxylase